VRSACRVFAAFFVATLAVSLPGPALAEPEIAGRFEGAKGTFVLLDLQRDRVVRHDPQRAAERFPPCSTFKVPNALVALDTGIVADAETVLRWDPKLAESKGPLAQAPPEWMRDHTLRSAMQYSVLWYFQDVARRVGAERYAKYLAAFDYGNRDISGGVDRFWLSSSLRISADEQVGFLKKLYTNKLPVSRHALDVVKDIIVLETTPEYRLSGKTGTGPLPDGGGRSINWLVGYLEKGGDVYVYALNLEGASLGAVTRQRRLDITKGILRDLGILH
jgi:beta-lactamase class D